MSQVFVPNGSYQQTVADVKVTLGCEARKIDGTMVPADLDLTSLSQADVENIDGTLVNTGGNAPIEGFVPGGSYKQTCQDIKVILTCMAKRIDGSFVPASFDLTTVTVANLANIDGQLVNEA